jgi:hypothetical protein
MQISNRHGLLALFLILATLLPSCVASSSVERSLRQYEGQPLEAAVGRFGTPEKVVADGSGGKVAYWSWIHDSRTVLFHFQIDKNDRIVGAYWRFREEPAQMPQDQPGPK